MTGVLFGHRLPALPFIAVRSEITSQQPICSLPRLNNKIDDLLSLPFVNRYFERLLSSGSPEKGDCQNAANIRLWLRMWRRLQNLDKSTSLRDRLDIKEELAYIFFVGEDQVLGFLSSEPSFYGMEPC